MLFLLMQAVAAGGAKLSMDNHSATGVSASPPTVGIQTRTDGYVYKSTGGAYSQDGTDWIRPVEVAASYPSVYVRFTETSSDPGWTYSSITPDGATWYDMTTATRTVNGFNDGAGGAGCQVTAEISMDQSTILDSGTWTLNSSDTS